MTALTEMSVPEAADKAIELIIYSDYIQSQAGSRWSEPFTGSFDEYVNSNYASGWLDEDESVEFSSAHVWEELMTEGSEGSENGWTGKVVATYGGEGQGDQYWMVVSVSDGETTRYFRRDGYYSSYGDGGTLDGEIYEVAPKEKMVVFYE